MKAESDRGERTALMEPLVLGEGSRHRAELTDLALNLAQRSAGFRRSLPERLLSSLATLVRSMNCYYSNLIEGRDTHPVDIERALLGDYSKDTKTHELQLEAKAHIAVQQWIDAGGLGERATTAAAIRSSVPGSSRITLDAGVISREVGARNNITGHCETTCDQRLTTHRGSIATSSQFSPAPPRSTTRNRDVWPMASNA